MSAAGRGDAHTAERCALCGRGGRPLPTSLTTPGPGGALRTVRACAPCGAAAPDYAALVRALLARAAAPDPGPAGAADRGAPPGPRPAGAWPHGAPADAPAPD